MVIFADIMQLGRLVDNYEKDATGATALWPDTTHYKAEVPSGMRWFVFGGSCYRDASATVEMAVYNASDEEVLILSYAAASAAKMGFPTTDDTTLATQPPLIILDEGYYIYYTFGAAQGANAYASVMAIEVPLEAP